MRAVDRGLEVEYFEAIERLGHAYLTDDDHGVSRELAKLAKTRLAQIELERSYHTPRGLSMEYNPKWRVFANCLDEPTSTFFPEDAESAGTALGICSSCVVRRQCLAGALERREAFGVWGGVLAEERQFIAYRAVVNSQQDASRAMARSASEQTDPSEAILEQWLGRSAG